MPAPSTSSFGSPSAGLVVAGSPVLGRCCDRLCELRNKRGETVRSLAERAGKSFPYGNDWKHGKKRPTLAAIVRLALALRCKATDLVGVLDKHDLAKLVRRRE